ncbi:M13 family metallopeptidase [bacterium]|nr:M13 family metallopeptidase [bacterium]
MENKFLNIIGIVAVVTSLAVAHHITKEENMAIGIKIENMDLSVRPGDDFYDYASRGWRDANPIPADYVRYGSFDVLRAENLERVRDIAERDNGKIGTLYRVAMNAEKLNADGTAPVMPALREIDAIASRDELPAFLGKMHATVTAFWGDGVALDEMDSEHFLYNMHQAGVGISRDYFFDDDEKSANVRTKYKQYITQQMQNFGLPVDADALYALEERMARAFHTKEVLRDPHANYHKIARADMVQQFPGFDWDAYFAARQIAPEFINMAQPAAITESIAIMGDTDLELIKTYLKWRTINSGIGLLDDKTYDIAFDFYNRTMAGQETPKPRWKRAVALIDDSLGEMVGQLYVDKYFPAAAKTRMTTLVENLRRALGMRIENLTWMSDETRTRALEKLSTFRAKIGYPDRWRDYTALDIRDDSLWDNITRVAEFEDRFWMDKIGQENDPNLWYMNAHEVNAYYDPSTNEICFPAGILQYPFFDMDADDAFNYGAIGSVIGHEMTHGFDDTGRHFDARGNMVDWWTPADADAFGTQADVLRRFFDGIEVAPGLHANGTFTLGENLADYGGITVAYTAYKNFATPAPTDATGLTGDMRFFIAYTGSEMSNIRDDAAINQTKTDEHSLSRWRVNGILPHIDAWYDAFGVDTHDKMYVAPDKRIRLW